MQWKLWNIGALLLFKVSLVANMGIQDAKTYHLNSQLQWNEAVELLGKCALKGNERVLDIGCGDGKITALIAKLLPQGSVVGVDISPQMIAFARENFPAETYTNLLFIEQNATELPFHEEFDLVFASHSLHWILDLQTALSCISESLKPGGMLMALLPAKLQENGSHSAWHVMQSEKWASYFPTNLYKSKWASYPSVEECSAMLLSVGLEPIYVETGEKLIVYPDREAFFKWLQPLVTTAPHLSPELQRAFIEDVIDRIVAIRGYTWNADGSLNVQHKKLEVIARKPIP